MKQAVLKLLAQTLSDELHALEKAQALAAKDATHEENRAENQYDTRSTEASYLAAGQAQRVEALKKSVYILQNFQPRDFNASDRVQLGALVELESEDDSALYLLAPTGGGYKVSYKGRIIQFLNQESALGLALLDKKVGNEVEIKTRKEKTFTIKSLR